MSDCVVLLHGWPGTREDWAQVQPLVADLPVTAVNLLGFGDAFTGPVPLEEAAADAHAARVLALLDAQGAERAVLAGYDIGSRVAQAVARAAPERVAGLVVTPGFPSLAPYARDPEAQARYWYQHLHRLPLAEQLLDGKRDAVAAYLTHIWTDWSGDDRPPEEELVDAYARPGAFTASIAWYRANAYVELPPLETPTIVLWGDRDPLFPIAWAEATGDSFTAFELRRLPGVGHFSPLEAPEAWARAIRDARRTAGSATR